MSDSSKLLVPMFMEALVLSNDKTDCVDLAPMLKNYTQSVLGDVLAPNPNNNITLKKGIHLHWTLPKALKHAFCDEDGDMEFPFVPNRWMVTRIQTDKDMQAIPSRMWLVESDSPNENTVNLVSFENEKFNFSGIGKKILWDAKSQSSNPAKAILTAVSPANPYCSSFYPGAQNVFGFHDDLSDLSDVDSNHTFTYIVTGWYSNPDFDPLAPTGFTVPINQEQEKRKREFDWFRQQWKCTASDYPESSLLHATIHSITWNENQQSGVPEGGVQIFAGNTAIEALSAEIVKSSPDIKPDMEVLLNALQYQLLEDERNQPGLKAIKNELHKMAFTPRDRGIVWEIARTETDDKQLENNKGNKPQFPDDPALLQELKALNNTQITANDLVAEIASLQQAYYLLWYKQALNLANELQVQNFHYDSARTKVKQQLDNKKMQLQTLLAKITPLKTKINQHKDLSGTNPEFELKEKLEERFWKPNEPVLLLCGSGVGSLNKPNFQTGNITINCRTSDMVYTNMPLHVQAAERDVSITVNDFVVHNLNKLNTPEIPGDEIKALILESLLFDQGLALDIALLAYQKADIGQGKDKTSPVIIDYANNIVIPAQQALLKAAPSNNTNTSGKVQPPAAFSVLKWQQAWTPLCMLWEVKYAPANQSIKNLDLLEDTKHWELEDQLFYKNQMTKAVKFTANFQGISPFSNAVFANLKKLLPDELVNKYGELNLIAQSLSGMHKHLLMQSPGIQLPPLEYDVPDWGGIQTDYKIDQEELDAIGPAGYQLGSIPGQKDGSDPNLFYPLRSGLVQLLQLSIVDAFGQKKDVRVNTGTNRTEVTCAESLQGVETISKNTIPLPPKIIQPSRLSVHWLNKKDEIIFQDTGRLESPVLAWFVPNYLDNSIMIYDESGKEIAILQITTDITKDKGLNVLKMPFPGTDNIPDLSGNPHLAQILAAIDKGSIAAGIMDLASKVHENLIGTQALQTSPSSMLCGQPIAMVRCSIRLQTMGLPFYNQRWDQSDKDNTGGIQTVKFPIFAGDFNQEKDGLIGYFYDTDASRFYSKLKTTGHAPEFKYSKSEPFFQSNVPLKILLNQEPLKMTLLLDPSAGVHFASGILPTKYLTLFAHQSHEILSSLNIGFLAAPFIAEKVKPGIPVPTSINANWKWTHKSSVKTWEKDAAIPKGKDKQLAVFKKQQAYEGWLKLSNLKAKK